MEVQMAERTPGIDISRYQTVSDWNALAAKIKFVAIRATVGDYYTDAVFPSHWAGAGNAGVLKTAYHVIAPADTLITRKISAEAQMNLFFSAMGDIEPDLPIVLDCELARNQTKDYITAITARCIELVHSRYGRMPIIYTRKTWFDYYTNPHPLFPLCDLFAARYSTTLTGPWSDGYYKFRDWQDWEFWQWSASGTLPGISSPVDMDWFNGSEDDLKLYAGQQTLEQRIAVLEREATLHGWNLTP
jgi:lysozyme